MYLLDRATMALYEREARCRKTAEGLRALIRRQAEVFRRLVALWASGRGVTARYLRESGITGRVVSEGGCRFLPAEELPDYWRKPAALDSEAARV